MGDLLKFVGFDKEHATKNIHLFILNMKCLLLQDND